MLKICNVSKRYDHTVLQDISFCIPDSAIVLLNGENGIGKTTLLYILGGLVEFEGDIFFDDASIKQSFQNYISKVTLIPNTPYTFEYLTVTEMIDLVISLSEKDKQASQYKIRDNLMHKLNLIRYKDVLTKNLSLGTKQKVSFICSFITSPSVVLIDEPFVNFDSNSLDTIIDYINEYVSTNKAIVIFSTHSNDNKINSIVTHKLTIQACNSVTISKMEKVIE